jgi:hypothetical protein
MPPETGSPADVPSLPTVVGELDRLRVQYMDEKIKNFDLQIVALRAQMEKLIEERKMAWSSLSAKYALGEKDSFHRDTGAIQRGA